MEPQIILVLGSFDKETKEVLNAVKNDVVKIFSGLDVYCFLLDDMELYASRDSKYKVLEPIPKLTISPNFLNRKRSRSPAA